MLYYSMIMGRAGGVKPPVRASGSRDSYITRHRPAIATLGGSSKTGNYRDSGKCNANIQAGDPASLENAPDPIGHADAQIGNLRGY